MEDSRLAEVQRMRLASCPVLGRLFAAPPARGDYHVTLPEGWDRWSPDKGDASAFFDRVNFVKWVSSTLVETANSIVPAGAPQREITLQDASAEEHGIPASALHFPGYTGHYVTVHAVLDGADELTAAQLRVHRYEGHADRNFALEHLVGGTAFSAHGKTIVVTPQGALIEPSTGQQAREP
jgi:hypothetical protein